jgi:hypothetical protein
MVISTAPRPTACFMSSPSNHGTTLPAEPEDGRPTSWSFGVKVRWCRGVTARRYEAGGVAEVTLGGYVVCWAMVQPFTQVAAPRGSIREFAFDIRHV